MILILSNSERETTTDTVMQWIEYLGGKILMCNGDNMIKMNTSIFIDRELSAKITYITMKISI
ncbi:MAG: hypothetical protein CR989_02585 [Flavobacteriales bacterium]|nr:MAG: hypothetical protein CR989_02585 [Flavobacteriales bacterium]